MFEDEDVILPDDFQDTPPQVEETTEEPVSEEVDNLETEQTEESTEQQPLTPEQLKFKVKYNHEEQEIGYDDAVPLIQKGMNYDKLQERIGQLESDPRMSFVEELAKDQGMDVNEYLEAFRNHREETKLQELVQQNIPEEYAREMLESRKFREQMKEQEKAKAEETKQQQESDEFFDYFKEANDRAYDPKGNDIPEEVWKMKAEQGVSLKIAYMQHHNKQLQNQIKVLKQNEENQKRAPISGLSTHGSNEVASSDDFMDGFDSI